MIIQRTPAVDHEVRLLATELEALADDLGLRRDEVCAVLRLPPGAWPLSPARRRCWQPDGHVEARLRRFVETLDMAVTLLASDAPAWLRTSNPALFHRRPIEILIAEPEALAAIRNRLRQEIHG